MPVRALRLSATLPMASLLFVSACGGGGSSGGGSTTPTPTPTPTPPVVSTSLTDAEAERFLTQTSFGVTDSEIVAVEPVGYANWMTQQMAMAPSSSHLTYVDNRLVQLRVTTPTATLNANQFYESFWLQAASAPDQLRQRVKLALSEIFVVSMADANVDTRGASSYYDMLGANAFGNFRDLLQNVALHPMMGVYLTSIANQKEDLTTGRHPDENFAREVMQLMTLGLYKLNIDGSYQLDGAGQPIASYTADDITNLAKVFTGMSWYSPTPTNSTFFGGGRDPNADVTPMIFYSAYHSISAKTFLGVTIPATTTADPAGDLKIALDTIFNNPNVGPFIARQLIQKLVTSNPSAAYIGRVATVFNNNGAGVRGDMASVVRAVLTDNEARDATIATAATYGKVREPLVRMGNWMRSFNAVSASGNYTLTSTSANTSLSESAMTSPSVFNFYRPGYVPPNTRLGAQNLTAPELQIVDEVSVVGYLNTMQSAVNSGVGTSADIKSAYAAEIAIASDSSALADRMNRLLLYGQMTAALKSKIVTAVNGVTIPATGTQAQIDAATLNRAKLAVFLTLASPDYLAQR
jgi:uncharacterized protein (DUF1800 family)